MTDHLLLDFVKLTGSVAVRSLESHRGEDEDGRPVARLDVDMRRIVLLRPEEEPVRSESMNGGHADLAAASGASILALATSPRLMHLRDERGMSGG